MDNFFFKTQHLLKTSMAGRPSPIGIDHECYRKMENGDRSVAYQQPETYHYQCACEIAQAEWKTGEGQNEEHPSQGCKPKDK